MTQSPGRSGPVPPAPPGFADPTDPVQAGQTPVLPARRGRLGPLHAAQVVLAEGAILALVAAADHGPVALGAAGVASVALLGAAATRRDGRWWFEHAPSHRQYRDRRLAGAATAHPDARLAALGTLAPGLTVRDVVPAGERSGSTGPGWTGSPGWTGTAPAPGSGGDNRVGVASDAAGWFAVLALGNPNAMANQATSGVPVPALVDALAAADQPGAVLQVVTHTVAVPGPDPGAATRAALSYRELQASCGPLPADQVTWVAVRFDAGTRARAGVDGEHDARHAPEHLAALARRIARSLRAAGHEPLVLDATGLLDALTRSLDLGATPGAGPAGPREEWDGWYSDRFAHATFWVKDWPPGTGTGAFLAWAAATPAALTSVATMVRLEGTQRRLRGLIRVAAPADRLAGLSHELIRGAVGARAQLVRMDGEQGPAAYASAPTGGGAA